MKKCQLSLPVTRWVRSDYGLAVPCEFTYDPSDPLVVTVAFRVDDTWSVHWAVARDLLADGLTTRCGEGDVVLWPLYDLDSEPAAVCLRIGSTDTALFEIPAEPIAAWLRETYDLVAPGTELDGVNWDELLQPAE